MKREIDNLPDLPPEAGECVIVWDVPRKDIDWTPCGRSWLLAVHDFAHPTLVARPVQSKRLEWGNTGRWSWTAKGYEISVTQHGKFSASETGIGHLDGSPFESLAEAKAACQFHADEQKRPTVAEQPKVETPDPGEGWRLVDPAVDKPGPGIEYWSGVAGEWRKSNMDSFHPNDIHRIRTTPAVAIQWPEGAIAIVRDVCGVWTFGSHRGEWLVDTYTGPDPFPAGLDWKQCFIINPKILNK